jgi:hypothetical protein
MANPITELAKRITRVERNVRALGSSSQLAYSSLEDGAITAFDADGTQRQLIGRQWDGTYLSTSSNGPIPPTPTSPSVEDGTESAIVTWGGTFGAPGTAGDLILPMDFLRVDIHVGVTAGFVPSHDNRCGTITAPTGGSVTVGLIPGTYYFKLVCWTVAGAVSASSAAVEADSWPVVVSSDGFPPASSPAVTALGGFDVVYARWTAITNFDPVWYDVHISTVSGFAPGPTTLVGSTQGTAFTIKQLPGAAPAPGDPDPRELQYFTDYYVKIVARDADGAAAAGAQGTDKIYQMTGVNLSADSVTAANVVAGTLTGDLFSASIILGSEIWTATSGQRVGMTPLGFFAYKPDGSIMLKIPTDGTSAVYDGELIVRGATVLGGMSIQSNQNELTADAVLTLMRGIVSPTASPQLADYYDTVIPSTAGLTAAQKTNNDPTWGLGGPFDFVASEVSCIEWRPVWGGGCFSIFQVRPNGTREWYFNTAGVPIAPAGAYFSDLKDWEVWSATEMLTSSTGGQNGHHLLFRFLPNNTYYVSAPTGIYSYTRQNTLAPPAIGNNGQTIFVAEVISTSHLNIRYYVPGSGGGAMPAPTTAYESTTGYTAGTSLAAMVYHPSGFDLGTARYMTAERGNSTNVKMIYTSGTNANSIFPHGSGDNWASPNKEAGSFEAPAAARRGVAWDGTQFWTLCSDGRMYKHTGDYWDPAVTSSTLWAQISFKDSDVAGTGTHETKPGTAKSFFHKRRAKVQWVAPSVPDNGGVDDPDKAVLYLGRGVLPGNTQPANSGMWKQTEAVAYATTTYTTFTTSGSNPLTINSFPSANPALIKSDDLGLQIKGDGYIRGVDMEVGPAGGTAYKVLTRGPYYFAKLTVAPSTATGAYTNIITWQLAGTLSSLGIGYSAGAFTLPVAGWYEVAAGIGWAANATGYRLIQLFKGAVGAGTAIAYDQRDGLAAQPTAPQFSRTLLFAANDVIHLRAFHTIGSAQPALIDEQYTYLQIRYIGPP